MSSQVLAAVQESLDRSPANAANHPLFARFLEPKSMDQIRRFAGQWYRAATAHKRAFPYLAAITDDDETRRELIIILSDEYGDGRPDMVHARLLRTFVEGLGLPGDPEQIEPAPEIQAFGDTSLSLWRDGDPVTAFGYHYALEYIAEGIHKVFYAGLQGNGFSDDMLRYFAYHSKAEEEHATLAEAGFDRYAADPANIPLLLTGVKLGEENLTNLWGGIDRSVYLN